MVLDFECVGVCGGRKGGREGGRWSYDSHLYVHGSIIGPGHLQPSVDG